MTVSDYADADPAVVKSGRVKKAVANAVEKEGKSLTMDDHSLPFTYNKITFPLNPVWKVVPRCLI